MKYRLLVLSFIFFCDSNANWAQLNYDTPSECFGTGAKRVFIPFPGFGTFACLKDAYQQLPDYEKSFQLLAGHTTAVLVVGLVSTILLIIGVNAGIPGCKEILGNQRP